MCSSAKIDFPFKTKVLVDAECTHDGSVKHIAKFHEQWGTETMEQRMPTLRDGTEEVRRLTQQHCPKTFTKSYEFVLIVKRNHVKRGWFQLRKAYVNSRCGELLDLQLRLLQNGFACLRPGGVLVYSTCSFTTAQNEVARAK